MSFLLAVATAAVLDGFKWEVDSDRGDVATMHEITLSTKASPKGMVSNALWTFRNPDSLHYRLRIEITGCESDNGAMQFYDQSGKPLSQYLWVNQGGRFFDGIAAMQCFGSLYLKK